ncbi:MAG: tRNA dimethylallyltransferase, partial [Ruminococcus sp.]
PSPYRAVKLGLNYKDREKLYDRINRRVDLMLAQGLQEEAQRVLASPLSCTSVMAIGYKELMPYFQNEATLEECIEKLKRETRRYAKRQLTWFRRDKEIHWLYADEYDSFEELYAAAVQTINEGLVYG